ncbi:MAG: recombination mediator RecR [Christensenellales bacterium]|jgi:recombination protein RecR
MIEPIAQLIAQLSKLPSVGPKTAQRLAFYIVDMPLEQVRELATAIYQGRKLVGTCGVCGNIARTDDPLCDICASDRRDQSIICVVRDARDVLAIERMRGYSGLYHVLGGTISPMDGRGPGDIRIRELLERLGGGRVQEVLIATNPDMEGEATALYIAQQIKPLGVKVSRIAHGVPVGGDLEYIDDVTLSRAISGRHEM